MAHPLLNWLRGDRKVHSGRVGDGMTKYAHNYSRITAALLALCAACGSGRPPATMGSKFVRMQDPAELDTENGLIATGLTDACLTLDTATAPTGTTDTATSTTTSTTDPTTGITTTTTTSTDPITGVVTTTSSSPDPTTGLTTTTTSSYDPATGITTTTTTTTTTNPTLTVTDPSLINTAGCGLNGMSPNLLGVSGLTPSSLSDDHFKSWFAADPNMANALMKYLVKCSLPAGLGLDFDYGGIHYVWPGLIGLAPHWAAGETIPEAEQQLVSACLALHANRYGAHVPISILGQFADGTPIPITDDELASFPVTEGCFFGNTFRNEGVFSANDRPQGLADGQSSLRACASPDRTGSGQSSMCPPIQYAGNCRDLCQPDPTNLYYLTCTVNGRTYRALSSRIQPSVDYTCGDGICQVTESCGTGSTWNDCGLDCGPCN